MAEIGVKKGATDVLAALDEQVQKSNPEGINQYSKGGGKSTTAAEQHGANAIKAEQANTPDAHKAAVEHHAAAAADALRQGQGEVADAHSKAALAHHKVGQTVAAADKEKDPSNGKMKMMLAGVHSKEAREASVQAHSTLKTPPGGWKKPGYGSSAVGPSAEASSGQPPKK